MDSVLGAIIFFCAAVLLFVVMYLLLEYYRYQALVREYQAAWAKRPLPPATQGPAGSVTAPKA